ncbi:Mobile element protein [methanotrophic endosymbiont of Bathymodiolus azoricus (Menez Gwen)]|nr:Mobile element protein [methanotrophic endosymbiont of Bathymodiolus azoricus (Menez Gwen)]
MVSKSFPLWKEGCIHKGSKENIMNIIGIDVSKNKLDCALINDSNHAKFKFKVVSNSEDGFIALIDWLSKHIKSTAQEYHFVMEATGVYHERCAEWLFNTGSKVSVVNPAHIKYYGQSLGVRSKNDKKDSVVLARYGLTQKPIAWEPETPEIRILKALASRLDAIEKDILREKNRYEKSSINPCSDSVLDSIKMILAVLNGEKTNLERLIELHINQYEYLQHNYALLLTIPGVEPVVSRYMLIVIGSRTFKSASQCAAYIGLVPIQNESGSSLKGRSRLSKAGNPVIRAKLYMAAISALQHNPDIKIQNQRLLKKGKSKISALCAAMRKLVHICFGVIKHQRPYQVQASLI